jgi:hypothetical protein
MRSKDKIDVRVEWIDVGDGEKKLWAIVRDTRTGKDVLVPSFEDLFRILLAIVYCENRKYQTLPWPASDMVKRFLVRCIQEAQAGDLPLPAEAYEAAWVRLDAEFKISAARTSSIENAQIICGPGCMCELCKEWPIART